MSKKVLLGSSLLLSLLASGVVFADDAAVDIVGPSGRSSMAVTDSTFNYRANEDYAGTPTLGGHDHETGSTLSVSGVYALSSRVNFTGSLGWAYATEDTFTWQGNSSTTSLNGIDENLGISAILLDNAGPGFKLVAAAGAGHSAGYDTSFFVNLEPQYRFDDQFLLTSSFGAQHESGYAGSTYANLNLVWKLTPAWSLVPSVGVTRYDAYQSWSSWTDTTEVVSVTWHINHDWSASASMSHGARSTENSDYYANDVADAHSYNYSIGVRHWF